ncbi:hypothetical protein NVP1031O_113 [Vibrio phage 1.031.O._10N.261.46.F8]|nr:hypothetical protein NVP1031O_113 [Vibrio phage 1.031.O._10N.261.46.F8]
MNTLSIVQTIKAAATSYYNVSNQANYPVILSDEDFDTLVDQLRATDPTHPILTTTGWGATGDDWDIPHWSHNGGLTERKFEHADPAASDLVYGVISEKLDGITIVARYGCDGKLIDCITRGDGDFGKDVTAMVVATGDVPLDLGRAFADPVEFRGEGIISYPTFLQMIESGVCNEFTHPRNVAAGIFNGSDVEKASMAEVVFFGAKVKGKSDFLTILAQYGLIDSLKLKRCEYIHTYECNAQLMEWWSEVKPNGGYVYPLDGFVQTSDTMQRKIKFKPEDFAEMEVKVTLRTTRTGRVIPHATFVNPKFISGATIRQCTLNNVNWCRTNFTLPVRMLIAGRKDTLVEGHMDEVEVRAGDNEFRLIYSDVDWRLFDYLQVLDSDSLEGYDLPWGGETLRVKDLSFRCECEDGHDGEVVGIEPNIRPIWDGAIVRVRRANEVIPEIFEVVRPATMPSDNQIAHAASVTNWVRKGTDIIDLDAQYSEANVVWNLLTWYSPKGVGGSLCEEMYDSLIGDKCFAVLRDGLSMLHSWSLYSDERKVEYLEKFSGTVKKERVRETFDTICSTNITVAHLIQLASIPTFGNKKSTKLEDSYYDEFKGDWDHACKAAGIPESKMIQLEMLMKFFDCRIGRSEKAVEVVESLDAPLPRFGLTGKLEGFKKSDFADNLQGKAVWDDKNFDVMVTDSPRISSKMQKALDAGKSIMSTAAYLEMIGA